MKNLDLPHPKKIDEAVPANLRCGQPGNEAGVPPGTMEDPHWAPLRFTFGGVWEVEPHWLEENLAKVRVVDVREPNEFTGPLGHIRGATLRAAGRARRARAGVAQGQADRRGVPRRQPFGARHRDPAEGGHRRRRQPARWYAALARRGPRRRGWGALAFLRSDDITSP